MADENGRGHILRSPSELVSLTLPTRGDGSHAELVEYVRTVLEQNTDLKPEYVLGTYDKLAFSMITSILHRLGIEWRSTVGD